MYQRLGDLVTRAAIRKCFRAPRAAVAFGCLLLGACGGSTPNSGARDWRRSPAVFQADNVSEIDALGDVHGDPAVTVRVLAAAGLVAAEAPHNWIGGRRVLIVTGDVIDKGAAATPIIDMLVTIASQAEAAGGKVVVTLGNHEAEFVADPQNSKSTEFRNELTSLGLDPAAVARGETKYGAWLASRPVAAIVDKWFFSHGGNTRGMGLDELATAYQATFTAEGKPQFDDPFLVGDNSLLEAQTWWFGSGAATSASNLDFDLAALPASHFVFGHDPGAVPFPDDPAGDRAAGEMVARYGGRLFMIDVGMSYAVGYSSGSLLRIAHGASDAATQILADGTTQALWP
jgi:hypothetical protein